jgi:hypothetical protein
VNDLLGTVLYAPHYRVVWSGVPALLGPAAAWVAVAAVTALVSVDLLRRPHSTSQMRPPSAWERLGVVVLLVATPMMVVATPAGDTFISANWAWTAFGWPAMLLVWRSPLGWLLSAQAANAALAILATVASRPVDRVDAARLVLTLYGATAIQLGLFLGCRFMQRVAARAHAAQTARAEVDTAKLIAEQVHAARQKRYREIGQSMGKLLTVLADGSGDPGDPQIRRGSAIAASRLRRLIAEHDEVPSPLLHELRACADMGERRGLQVGLEMVGELPELAVPVRRALTEAPIHLLAAATTQARITIIASRHEVEVSAVADVADDADVQETAGTGVAAYAAGVSVGWSRDEEAVWVRTMWYAP